MARFAIQVVELLYVIIFKPAREGKEGHDIECGERQGGHEVKRLGNVHDDPYVA
jgi:hypothetical protein